MSGMRIVICPDSFKGSLSAAEAARSIASGALSAAPDAEIDIVPLADGGEGTVEAMVGATGGELVEIEVTGPLGRPVSAFYGIIGASDVAVIEMAAAAGLVQVSDEERNPLITTTRGVGELILAAYNRGCRKFVIGIGGSATNDGGAGAMTALGIRFLDSNGRELSPGGASLVDLDRIDTTGMLIDPSQIEIRVACDVTNPLVGPTGASAVYGPQKGATPDMVESLDRALARYADVIQRDLGISVAEAPGAGAAGGLGAGLLAFLGARLESGIDIVLDITRFDERLKQADLVITGEGRVDQQTAYGKTISGVLKRASVVGVPVIILAGSVGEGTDALYDLGATAVFSIAPGPITLEECMSRSSELLSNAGLNCVRLFKAYPSG